MLSEEGKNSVCIGASALSCCRVCSVCLQSGRQASCRQLWLWCPCHLSLRRQVVKRIHVLFPLLVRHRPSSSPVRSGDSIGVGWCFDNSARRELKTLTSKNARCRSLPQKLSAAMSSRAPSSRLAVLCNNCSPVTGCRLGSVPTLWHTSIRKSAVISRISLWRIDGNPPRGQLKTCSTVNCLLHAQWDGRCGGRQPYRRQRASLKAPLWRANPCSSIGRVESQLEAPFSVEALTAL